MGKELLFSITKKDFDVQCYKVVIKRLGIFK